MSRESIYARIDQERDRQDHQHGGPAHDRQHTPADWVVTLTRFLGKAADSLEPRPVSMPGAGSVLYGPPRLRVDYREHRHRLVQVAAIAVAALEALDADGRG